MSNYGKCPSCGSWVPRGDSECPHCGARTGLFASLSGLLRGLLASPGPRRSGRLCVVCDRLIGINDDTCPHCGVAQSGVRKAARAVSDLLPGGVTATSGLLGAMVVLFLLPVLAGGAGSPDFTLGGYLASGDPWVGIRMGALHSELMARGEWWRLVTAGYLHFGALHLLFNGFALTILGRMTEQLYGVGWFLFIFVLTGAVSFLLSWLGHTVVLSAGASGSIFGLIGLGIVFCLRHRSGNEQMLRTLVTWTLLSVVMGMGLPVDNWAHGGGFVSGALCGRLLPPEVVTRGRRMNRVGRAAGVVAGVVVLVAFGLNVALGGRWL